MTQSTSPTSNASVVLRHNLDPKKFVYLWMKYVNGFNDAHHCTNCLRGKYSQLISKRNNPDFASMQRLVLNEQPADSYGALYLCGVAQKGYSTRSNYPHNLHAPIQPMAGESDTLEFEHWRLRIENGVFLPIRSESKLPVRYKKLPPEYTTCRIFRWAAGYRFK